MQVIAQSRSVNISPRKVRLVAESVKMLYPEVALTKLSVLRKRAARPLSKALKSALANAVNNKKVQREDLRIKAIEVTEAAAMKRFHPSTRGRIHPYKKRMSHIRVILEAIEKEVPKKATEKKKEENEE